MERDKKTMMLCSSAQCHHPELGQLLPALLPGEGKCSTVQGMGRVCCFLPAGRWGGKFGHRSEILEVPRDLLWP